MAAPGGPSTINGVLYQMLWSLLRATRIYVDTVRLDERTRQPTEVLLRLEPAGGGGDLQELGPDSLIVEQVKSRAAAKPWSLREIIKDVLPDLYKAVEPSREHAEYRFVTEGYTGDWQAVHAFFQQLRHRQMPQADILASLDNVHEVPFRKSKTTGTTTKGVKEPFWAQDHYTERSLFEHIVEQMRANGVAGSREPLEVHKRLWHLLANFVFVAGQSAERLQQEVDSLLLALIDHRERLPQIRQAMLMGLAERAAQGHADIAAAEFLDAYGLKVLPLTHWSALRERARHHLRRHLGLAGYVPDEDILTGKSGPVPSTWGVDHPILLIAGESGQGKSWSLARLALTAATGEGITVFVEAKGDADRDLQAAADEFWQKVKGNDGSLTLTGAARRRQELVSTSAGCWLSVFIDGVQDIKEARDLAKYSWKDEGIRLAISCSRAVAEEVDSFAGERCIAKHARDFSLDEVYTFLAAYWGDDWPEIPEDVRRILRRPLLARIYRQVAADKAWHPTTEYALYRRYWVQQLQKGKQHPYPLDEARIRKAAASLLGGTPYPWQPEQLATYGLDNEAIARLCQIGLLRRTESGRFEIWHDRLLNWAVAEGLAVQAESQQEQEQLCQSLAGLFEGSDTFSGRHLGYVPMDVLWLLLNVYNVQTEVLARILEALEGSSWHRQEILYDHLLRTLGHNILPALFARLRIAVAKDDLLLERRAIEAIASYGCEQTAHTAATMLSEDSPYVQRAAMRILAKCPSSDVLDPLWELHCQREQDPSRFLREHDNKYQVYDDTFGALRACARLDPQWLVQRIQKADPAREPVHDLSYLLSNVDRTGRLWHACKYVLFDKVSPVKQRCLAMAIGRYLDADEVDWLVQRVADVTDLVGASALRALACIDPDLAIDQLPRLPHEEIYLTRAWTFGELLARRPAETRRKFLSMLRQVPDPWRLAYAYQGQEGAIDVDTLDYLLGRLEDLLDKKRALAPLNQQSLSIPLAMLADMNRLELVNCFSRRRGTPLEDKLADWLIAVGPQKGQWRNSHTREPGMDVLHKIGRRGFVRVVNAYLDASEDRFGLYETLEWAIKGHNDRTIQVLEGLSQRPHASNDFPLVQQYATLVLAAAGRWHAVIESIILWGRKTLLKVLDLRLREGALDDDVMQPALRIVRSRGQRLVGAVMAIGFGRRIDQTEHVLSIFRESLPGSDLADACVFALICFRDQSAETLSLLARELQVKKHLWATRRALLHTGTDDAKELLLSHLRTDFDLDFALALASSQHTRQDATSLILERLDVTNPEAVAETLRVIRATAGDGLTMDEASADVLLREPLLEAAFAEEERGWIVASKAKAIRGLAAISPDEAFLAAWKTLQDSDAHDRHYYPQLMVDINRSRAIPALLEQTLTETSTRVTWAIGRALYAAVAEREVLDWLDSTDAARELAACKVAGKLMPTDQLTERLRQRLMDLDGDISAAARQALADLADADGAQQLLMALTAEQNPERQWVLLDALLSLADPGDDSLGPNPQWIGDAAKAVPAFMHWHIKDRLKKRREELIKKARDHDKTQ